MALLAKLIGVRRYLEIGKNGMARLTPIWPSGSKRVCRRRSVFAFYTLMAALTWIFTLGPRPKLLGHPLLYRGPYALLMLLPGFDDRLRAPARGSAWRGS